MFTHPLGATIAMTSEGVQRDREAQNTLFASLRVKLGGVPVHRSVMGRARRPSCRRARHKNRLARRKSERDNGNEGKVKEKEKKRVK